MASGKSSKKKGLFMMTPEEKKVYMKEYNKAYKAKNKFEFNFITKKIYGAQRESSRRRGHIYPDYDLGGLREWMLKQDNLSKLLKDYKASGGEKDLCPSVDRLDDEVGYTLGNIQLGTWRDNYMKEVAKQAVRQSRSVIQLDLNDEVIKEWAGTREAGRALGIDQSNISKVCRGVYNHAGGYKFKYS